MSGELEGLLVILSLNTIYAYGVFLAASSGQLNLGAAGFVTLGAYASGYLTNGFDGLGVPIIVGIPIAVLFVGVVAFLISFPILRTRGVYMVLATFAFAEVVAGLVINAEFLGGAAGMPIDVFIPFYVVIFSAVAVALLCFYLMSTRFGLAMRSVHDDESVAILFGVNARMVRVWAFTLGAAILACGGALYGHHYSYVETQNFNMLLSIYVLLYVLLGGTQTALGPFVGALFFTFVPELLRAFGSAVGQRWIEDGRLVAFGLIIVLMMVFRPEGVVTRTMLAGIFNRKNRGLGTAE